MAFPANPTDEQLDMEFAMVGWEQSCKDIFIDLSDKLFESERLCRRDVSHLGACAAGFGSNRKRWNKYEEVA